MALLDPNTNVKGAVRELQGYTVTLLAGAGIDTKIDVAAIRAEDTIISVIHNASGTLADVTSEAYVWDIKAYGTITAASVVAGDTVTIADKVYRAVAGDNPGTPAQGPVGIWDFGIGAGDDETADNLAAKINARNAFYPGGVTATSDSVDTVTVTSKLEGEVGNAVTLVESTSGARITLSAATLENGTDTGGIALDTTNTTGGQLLVSWYNKKD